MKLSIKANAKINIGLKVLGKRNDGYHNIDTIFYPVRIYDIINIHITPVDRKANIYKIDTDNKELRKQSNLCIIAAKLFFKSYAIHEKYEIAIKLKKNIPVGAGLGGGSSDAAGVLKLLSIFFSLNRNEKKRLPELALELGSDVPFFLQNEPCYATGRGEKLRPMTTFKIPYSILIAAPDIHVSTASAYKALGKRGMQKPTLDKVKKFNSKNKDLFENDFEKVIFRKHPEIQEIKNHMYLMGAVFSSMSGSGSSVYGFFKNYNSLKSASTLLRSEGYKTFVG